MKNFDTVSLSFDTNNHDHGRCIHTAMKVADKLCLSRSVRLTPARRRVLELIWESHHPVGAYDVLSKLSQESGKTAPPTVYRALEFLMEQGLIHRIESLNAYVGCAHPAEEHAGLFLICTDCGCAAEVHDEAIDQAIVTKAATLGFRPEQRTLEVRGTCPDCRPNS
ncbi:Fur family transcriptional regulator [Kiloniella laminariae]|uniref:Fur family transcriptional regulator n=1 Tax=Kiloniella laminariae TaxID=454162 RepID=UPI0003816D64|nr:Fur family transcriptional regulator [Kiloniella laminariae]